MGCSCGYGIHVPGDKEHVLNNISLKYENVLLEYCNLKEDHIPPS